ncbi:MAG: hypothetical protein IPN70_01795 [Candidatus Moraniibacteriota bacterium]|nr:MAG: hypothetical protein IPN70_01795 [Candidatus Moranbacteria bacterium]
MFTREKKRFFYASIFVLIFLFLAGAFADFFFIPEPSCTDKKLNQNELYVDCGGVCPLCSPVVEARDVEILETAAVPVSLGKFDLVARIKNTNNLFGSGSFSYTFNLLDEQKNIIRSVSDTTYILPAQERYLILLEVESIKEPSSVELIIDTIAWEEFSEYESPKLNVTNKSFEISSSGANYAVAKGLVWNESPYDFETIEIFVVLRDDAGKIIGVNRTDMQTVKAGEKRDFPVYWMNVIKEKVASIDILAITNMFENQNFIKIFFPSGKFQDYEKK